MTARTAPHHCAVRPLSNSPSSFEPPRNSELTAETRPRISGGVGGAQHAQAAGSGVEDVLRKNGHEGDGSAEQDGEEVKRDRTEQDRGSADVPESGKDDVHGEGAVLHAAGADGKRGDQNQEPDEGD